MLNRKEGRKGVVMPEAMNHESTRINSPERYSLVAANSDSDPVWTLTPLHGLLLPFNCQKGAQTKLKFELLLRSFLTV